MTVEKPKSDCPPFRYWVVFSVAGGVFAIGLWTCASTGYGWLAQLWS
jgi:hypothetical protein